MGLNRVSIDSQSPRPGSSSHFGTRDRNACHSLGLLGFKVVDTPRYRTRRFSQGLFRWIAPGISRVPRTRGGVKAWKKGYPQIFKTFTPGRSLRKVRGLRKLVNSEIMHEFLCSITFHSFDSNSLYTVLLSFPPPLPAAATTALTACRMTLVYLGLGKEIQHQSGHTRGGIEEPTCSFTAASTTINGASERQPAGPQTK